MVYKFRIISDEVDDFCERNHKSTPEASFFDFHEAILKSVAGMQR